jgi:hypothetical protein
VTQKTFQATIVLDGSSCHLELPFDPAPVFGKTRAPVVVTLSGHSFRSTIAAMGGQWFVPLRRSNREAAGLVGGETVAVTLALDDAERTVAPPADLRKALAAARVAAAWDAMSYTHQREHVEAIEQAKKPETRERRVAAAVAMVAAKAAAKAAKPAPAKPAKPAPAKPAKPAPAKPRPAKPAPAKPKPAPAKPAKARARAGRG